MSRCCHLPQPARPIYPSSSLHRILLQQITNQRTHSNSSSKQPAWINHTRWRRRRRRCLRRRQRLMLFSLVSRSILLHAPWASRSNDGRDSPPPRPARSRTINPTRAETRKSIASQKRTAAVHYGYGCWGDA